MTRKILKAAIILAVIAGLGILGYSIVSRRSDKSDKDYKSDEDYRWKLSEKLTVIVHKTGERSVLNNATNTIMGKYDDIFCDEKTDESVVVVIRDFLFGYISTETGEAIFEPQFLYAWPDGIDFESGLASCVNKEHKLGFVNVKTKEIAIPFQFQFTIYYDYVFSNGFCRITESFVDDWEFDKNDFEIGLIDTSGKIIIPANYDEIDVCDDGIVAIKNGMPFVYDYNGVLIE